MRCYNRATVDQWYEVLQQGGMRCYNRVLVDQWYEVLQQGHSGPVATEAARNPSIEKSPALGPVSGPQRPRCRGPIEPGVGAPGPFFICSDARIEVLVPLPREGWEALWVRSSGDTMGSSTGWDDAISGTPVLCWSVTSASDRRSETGWQ
ncbi:unnamed protein product [Gadus morhua 'NCC']